MAALVLILAIAGCSSKSPSPAASSTASSSTSSTSAETTTSEKSTETSTSTVPAPPNSLTMTCKEWRDLDDPTQLAVVNAIVTEPDFKGKVTDPDAARIVAKGACLLFGDKVVKDVLLTGS
jgi:ABC-type enterochelin transport system substrate-binding protein